MQPKFSQEPQNIEIKWKCDLDRSVIFENMEERGWDESSQENDWNFYWIAATQIKKLFQPSAKTFLGPKQLANHFQNHYELTRKDLMAKNIKKYQREYPRESITLANGEKLILQGDIIPITFLLPQEQGLFLEEFIKNPNKQWIFKPAGKSQGSGITLVTKISQVRNMNSYISSLRSQVSYVSEHFLISKYVESPLLLNSRKFDLRLFVLVTSYKPLKVWKYREGFARVCFEQYSNSKTDDPNKALFGHLTNVSFQKQSNSYNNVHGGKFPFSSFLLYLELNFGKTKMNNLLRDVDALYLQSLKSVQNVIISDKHCFELYGFDVLIDENLKPWLVEVNASPSLVSTTTHDKKMKKKLISDLCDIVMPRGWLDNPESEGSNTCKEKQVGGFDLLYDEIKDPFVIKVQRPKSGVKKPSVSQNWKNYMYN